MQFNSLIPELSVSDIHRSVQFYQKLGFEIQYERIEDKFYFLQLENNQIMLEEVNNNWNTAALEYPYGRGMNLSMRVSDIDAMFQRLQQLNISFFEELETHAYQVGDSISYDREFLIQDPDGYLLRFND